MTLDSVQVLKGKSQLWCKKFLSHLFFAKPSLTISNMTIFIPYISIRLYDYA